MTEERVAIFILAAFVIGFLFGMVLETLIDTKTIREQTVESNKQKVIINQQRHEIARLKEENSGLHEIIKNAANAPIHILDHRDVQASQLFNNF